MNPYPRIRKTVKWGGAALTVLLVMVWIGSGWVSIACGGTGAAIGAFAGRVWIIRDTAGVFLPIRWGAIGIDEPLLWWFQYYGRPGRWEIHIPLWLLAAASLLLTALAFRLDTLARHRERMHLCQNCGYDRTGLAGDAVCPECGAASTPKP